MPRQRSSSRRLSNSEAGAIVCLVVVCACLGGVFTRGNSSNSDTSGSLAVVATDTPELSPTASATLPPAWAPGSDPQCVYWTVPPPGMHCIPYGTTPAACTTLNCNPWGYDFNAGTLIYNPPGAFCNYFACIPSFWNGSGYVVECQDSLYSLSGGNSGACSSHGGVWRALYSH